MAIAGEVITFAEPTGNYLLRVDPFVTIAHPANTLSPSTTFDGGVRLPTAFGQTRFSVDVRSRALTLVAMVELIALAYSALVRANTTTLLGVLLVVLITRKFTRTATEHLNVHR